MEVGSRSQRRVATKDLVPIEYVPEDKLVAPIKKKMETLSLSGCISRVSEEHQKGNGDQYFPMLVSIGPFHHGKEPLKSMEDQKWCYLNALLSRYPNSNSNVEARLDNCLKMLKRLEEKARKCYAEYIDMESDEFVQMMLVDGCFIIELFLNSAIKGLRRRDDPCFSPVDRLYRLMSDLILLENQIPFFIVEHLFQLVPIPKQCSQSPAQLALRFFRKMIPGAGEILPERIFANINHILDLIRQCYLPTSLELQTGAGRENVKSATNIHYQGIQIRLGVGESLLNIQFDRGVLEIPPLKINIYTQTLFRNLIALEHCCSQYTKHITSYLILMRCLIQSKNDVRLLRGRGILVIPSDIQRRPSTQRSINAKEDDPYREILHLFKKLHVDLNMDDFYYRGLCEQINNHQSRKYQLSLLWCK